MSYFNDIELLPPDPILSLPIDFKADPRTNKVNLGIGAYQTADGSPLVLTCVRKAEAEIIQKNLSKDYLPISGDAEFLNCGLKLLFGSTRTSLNPQHIFSAQTIGGTGALRVAGEFLAKNIGSLIFLPEPSWPNHKQIFERAGLTIERYPYHDEKNNKLDFFGMCQAIKNMPSGSFILLQACCHNPTGFDPSPTQWEELSTIIKKQKIIPIFDQAYQGFGESIEKDAFAIRFFAKEGHEMIVCYSFAKNFGLYGERAGFITILTTDEDGCKRLASQVKYLIRANYSSPPLHGSRIVSQILKSPELTKEWETELNNMRDRIKEMRLAFAASLQAQTKDKDYSYINLQGGLFCFGGLSSNQVIQLRQENGIYLPSNGRINIAGLTTQNLDYVVKSIVAI